MKELLNLTIKIDKNNKYQNATTSIDPRKNREIETGVEIKNQHGGNITELKESGFSFGGSFLVKDIKKIAICFPDWDIPISWAWENRGTNTEIEFTLKNLIYNQTQGLRFGNLGPVATGTAKDTLFLNVDSFEVDNFVSDSGESFFHIQQAIELKNMSSAINQVFNDFRDLIWQIQKAVKDEQITNFIPKIQKYQNATTGSPEEKFYRLKSTNDGEERVKKICQDFLQEIQELTEWKNCGIKTIAEARLAKENGFDIFANSSLKSQISSGKYRGFPITSQEKYETLTSVFGFGNNGYIVVERNRYTKDNIDIFREFFTNDADQSDPKYFRGFYPGDIDKLSSGKFVSANHMKDIKSKQKNEWEIKGNEEFTRTYYEIKSVDENNGTNGEMKDAIFWKESFNEMAKTKNEHWDIYWKWIKQLGGWDGTNSYLENFNQKLTDLLPLFNKSYDSESKENCKTDLNILKGYERLSKSSYEKEIKKKFSSEIDAKKTEIENRLNAIHEEALDAATNEDYGAGNLSDERKKIFTVHKSEITNEAILAEIQALIKLLVKGDKAISGVNQLEKMFLANKLKEEYQKAADGDKKTAYNITNKVDNNWVDHTITELEAFKARDKQTVLNELRTELQTKYDNHKSVFGNSILDSVDALKEAEKLLIKVQEAEGKNDTDASLLTLLQKYQKAKAGTTKNKAWQAVNGINNQAEAAINHLQKSEQSREEIVKSIQDAKNENELQALYDQAKNSELYKEGDKSKTIIDNLNERKKVCFQIEKEDISTEVKNFLQEALTKIIPDTIKEDSEEQELTELENQLKTFQTAGEGEEKGKIYKKYNNIINKVLTEIHQEKQRYQKAKQEDIEKNVDDSNKKSKTEPSGLPIWVWVVIIVGIIAVVGIIAYFIWNQQKNSKRGQN